MFSMPVFLNGGGNSNHDDSGPFSHLGCFFFNFDLLDWLTGSCPHMNCQSTVLFLLTFCNPGKLCDKIVDLGHGDSLQEWQRSYEPSTGSGINTYFETSLHLGPGYHYNYNNITKSPESAECCKSKYSNNFDLTFLYSRLYVKRYVSNTTV